VYVRSKAKKEFVEACVEFFIRSLKLKKSSWNLIVLSTNKMKEKLNASGAVYLGDEKTLVMELDSRLNGNQLIDTISHEMIHVKQYATGMLREENGNTYWRGKIVNRSKVLYWDHPWERNAWKNQTILSNMLYSCIDM
jgi:hypothetical protein